MAGSAAHLLILRANPRPNMYIRELPIAIHTKFIEQHVPILTRLLDALLPAEAIDVDEKSFERRYGLRYDTLLVRIRLLDDSLQARLGLPLADVAAPVAQLAALPKGKLAAQVAHASVGAFLAATAESQATWLEVGMPKIVVYAADADALMAILLTGFGGTDMLHRGRHEGHDY